MIKSTNHFKIELWGKNVVTCIDKCHRLFTIPPPGSTLTQLEIDKTNKVVEAVLDKRGEGDHTGHSKHGK